MKHNAVLSSDYDKSIREVAAAIKAAPLHLLRYAASNGWLPDNTAFVNSSGIIDFKNRRQKILPPRWLNAAQQRGGKPEGDLEGWIRDVAGPCRCSDLAMTLLSAAFPAPLLKMTDRHSFGLNIYGTSKTGRSRSCSPLHRSPASDARGSCPTGRPRRQQLAKIAGFFAIG